MTEPNYLTIRDAEENLRNIEAHGTDDQRRLVREARAEARDAAREAYERTLRRGWSRAIAAYNRVYHECLMEIQDKLRAEALKQRLGGSAGRWGG